MNIIENTFASANKTDNISYRIYTPDTAASAVIQIVHGMCEHQCRYEEFARYLCGKGFVVCTYDQAGHGKSIGEGGAYGFFADNDGDTVLVDDMETMIEIVRKKYRTLPYIVFAHSMGSFVARAFIATHPLAVDGAIFSGTCGVKMPAKAAKAIASIEAKIHGKKGRSKFLQKLVFGKNDKKAGKVNGWLTTDENEYNKYQSDELCGGGLTIRGYYDMFELIRYICSDEWFDDMPKGLSVLITTGENDPIGDYGNGVKLLYEKMLDSDMSDVSFKLYNGEKHEMTSGLKRKEYFEDIYTWINRVCTDIKEAKAQRYADFGGINQ